MAADQDSILVSLKQAVIEADQAKAIELAQVALDSGVDPLVAIENGLSIGLRQVGDAFDRGDAFLPDIVMSGQAMKAASAILEAKLKESPSAADRKVNTIVIGTVQNDIHDIGKSLVALLLSCAGWNVIDLGTNVSTDKFIEAAEKNGAKLIGLSSLLTTTAPEMGKVIGALKEKGVRSSIKVIVGGGAITEDYAQRIGADAYAVDASDGVRKANALLAYA